jgi:small subunit ribosomal protein S6
MSIQHYECLFLLDPTKVSGNLDGAKNQLHTMMEKHGAQIVASRPWDDRKLTYPIKGHKKGQYYLVFYSCESTKLTEMQHDFRLNELILRHLVQLIPPKWLNEMMEVAKDDHRMAYQAAHEEPQGGDGLDPILGEDGIPNLNDGPGGRPRRGGPRHRSEGDKD